MTDTKIMKTTLTVNMHCEGCAANIGKNIGALEGVSKVLPQLEKGKVTIEYLDGKVSVDKLKQKIRELGYTVG